MHLFYQFKIKSIYLPLPIYYRQCSGVKPFICVDQGWFGHGNLFQDRYNVGLYVHFDQLDRHKEIGMSVILFSQLIIENDKGTCSKSWHWKKNHDSSHLCHIQYTQSGEPILLARSENKSATHKHGERWVHSISATATPLPSSSSTFHSNDLYTW